jgi:hypothetical protein
MTKKKTAGRSTERPGLPKENQSGFPYGTGSLQRRGRTFWIMYRDPEGRSIQENSRLEDFGAARRMLAERAIVTLEARLAVLKGMLDETEDAAPGHGTQPDGDGAKRGSSRGTLPKDSAIRQKRTGAKGVR